MSKDQTDVATAATRDPVLHATKEQWTEIKRLQALMVTAYKAGDKVTGDKYFLEMMTYHQEAHEQNRNEQGK